MVDIVGVGIDCEYIERFRNVRSRVFNKVEVEHCESRPHPSASYAGVWCVKEAIVKALAPVRSLSVRDVEVLHTAKGRPTARVSRLESPLSDEYSFKVSISHSNDLAVAVAVAMKDADYDGTLLTQVG